MVVMRRALASQGYATLNLGYDSRYKTLEASAEQIHPSIMAFQRDVDGAVHFVTHSMGGLLARVYLATSKPMRMGRVVMLGPPNGGSEMADLLHRSIAYRALFGPAGRQLTTVHASRLQRLLGLPDYDVGIIAGTRSINILSSVLILREPNDGKVTVRRTRLEGAADHITLPVSHPLMMQDPKVLRSTISFLRHGSFR